MQKSDLKKYLQKYNAQEKIDKQVKRYKRKKVIIFGMDEYAQAIFENYKLSGLNIIAVADLTTNFNPAHDFFGYKCISSDELHKLNFDIILVANYDYKKSLTLLDDHILYLTPKQNVEIRPLIRLTFYDIFFKNGYKQSNIY